MSLILRDYQKETVDKVLIDLKNNKKPLFILPPGTGKSAIIAALTKELKGRKLIIAPTQELVEQNYNKFRLMGGWAGVYCASLGRKELHQHSIFATLQSVSKVKRQWDHIIIDECHLVPSKQNTLFRKFLATQKTMSIIGGTATPYRLDSGYILDNGIFDSISCDYSLYPKYDTFIEKGFLVPLISKKPENLYDTSSIHIKAGEYVQKELSEKLDVEQLNKDVVAEIEHYGKDRLKWLIFAISIEHAQHLKQLFQYNLAVVHSKLSQKERQHIIFDFKRGRYKGLINVNMLTTGFDCPDIDLIACCRPTTSHALWVQMLGRGTRPCFEAQKENCLILDFGGNTLRLGPINYPFYKDKKRTSEDFKKEAPIKICKECFKTSGISARICKQCGKEFDMQKSDTKLTSTASTQDVLVAAKTYTVKKIKVNLHRSSHGTDSIRLDYCVEELESCISEWFVFEGNHYAVNRAWVFWAKYVKKEYPKTTIEAYENFILTNNFKYIKAIKKDKFYEIIERW